MKININMDSDKMCIAFFKKKKFTLTINVIGNGSVTGAGVYDKGTVVDLNAVAEDGCQFSHWEGDLTGDTNPAEVTMNSNKTVTAYFTAIEYTLTTEVDPEGSGTITGAGTYDTGTNVEVEATPNEDYEFDRFEVNGEIVNPFELGMVLVAIDDDTAKYDGWVDTLLADGFTTVRECPDFSNQWWYDRSKAAVIRNAGRINYVWGVSFGNTITSSNWEDYRTAVLTAAQWAQDNGVYEFQIGNEEEMFIDGTTMTVTQLIANLKSLATEVKQIFTNGNVSYSCWQESINDWINAGKGDLDYLACNIYRTYSTEPLPIPWESRIDSLVNAFGDDVYFTEFNLNVNDINNYSTDEAVQATAITEMIDYMKNAGIKRAFYFVWYHPSFDMGVLKADGTYRELWQSLLNS